MSSFTRSAAGEWTSDDHRRFVGWLVAYELQGTLESAVQGIAPTKREHDYQRALRKLARIVKTGSGEEIAEAAHVAWDAGIRAYPGHDETALRIAVSASHEIFGRKGPLDG